MSEAMRTRGRPRGFDREAALRRAMRLFWERGYEGTSIADLAAAIGINKPSLYAAFGSKESLFREAVALYDAIEGRPVQEALDSAPSARLGIEAALRHNALVYCRAEEPRGCMIVLSSLLGTAESEEVRSFLTESRRRGEAALRRRIERGLADGDVPPEADPRRLAAFYTTVMHGLSVQARDGAGPQTLDGIVDCAMASWDRLVGSH